MHSYLCIFRSSFGRQTSNDRRLRVDADDVKGAIKVLRGQMRREKEKLSKIIAVAPEYMLSKLGN